MTQPCCGNYLPGKPCPGPDLCPFSGYAARVAQEEQMIAIAREEEAEYLARVNAGVK